MMKNNKPVNKKIGLIAGEVGMGLLAGLAGTAAMTVIQTVEMKVEGREPSDMPEKAAEKVFDVEPKTEETKGKISNLMHFAYGTTWGAMRGILRAAGIRGWAASAIHFVTIWGAAQIILPKLNLSPPFTKWSKKQIVVDVLHHIVYAFIAGLIFDLIDPDEED